MRYQYCSRFAPYIEGLIEQKLALGYDYTESQRILHTFDRFCTARYPAEELLTQELALKWAEATDTEHNLYRLNRVSVIRELARYMNSIGIAAYVIPLELTRKTERHVPHIYSMEELGRLFAVIDRCKPSRRSPAKHLVVAVVFRMIYCCGLRPVEARRLLRENVDLNDGTIYILESKGHKDRIVVMSGDMLDLCRKYDKKADSICPDRKYFFQSPSCRCDGMYSMAWIIPTFKEFLTEAEIYDCSGNTPRLYDLRHTFATRCLYKWMHEGRDINACLAFLSEYMGHKHISSTAYYIHLIPGFYSEMAEFHFDRYPTEEEAICG